MPPGTPSTRRCRRDGGSACRQSSNVGVSASLEHRTRGGPIVDPSPDSFPSFRLSGRSSTGLCSPRWFVRRHPQEVLDSHHAQEESNGKWHQLPRRVNEELGSAEMDPSPTRLQLRLPRRQDVLDSLDIGAVGQGEYVRIAALEDVHGCSIRIARPPPAVADQREAWQPRSEPRLKRLKTRVVNGRIHCSRVVRAPVLSYTVRRARSRPKRPRWASSRRGPGPLDSGDRVKLEDAAAFGCGLHT